MTNRSLQFAFVCFLVFVIIGCVMGKSKSMDTMNDQEKLEYIEKLETKLEKYEQAKLKLEEKLQILKKRGEECCYLKPDQWVEKMEEEVKKERNPEDIDNEQQDQQEQQND
mmetsp:Transcript_13698/g.20660  ORF Transcript_13698/g.20660 Transcript_13698/m.20660 type:complete len:111 (-) Transcript_13698:95-427(-)